MNETEEYILSILRPMIRDKKRYGDMVVSVQAGEVVNVREDNNHKPPWSKRKVKR